MKVRLAKKRDVMKIYGLAKNELSKYTWFNINPLIKNLKEEPELCFVMERDKKVEGAIFFRQEWNTVVWAWLIFLEKHMRHKGLAHLFEKKVLDKIKKSGFDIVYLEVDESNKHMLDWCKRNKYKKISKFPDWFGKGNGAIIFQKEISD